MISKPVRIITSLGRTGTLFFSRMLSELMPTANVFHEVGYLNFGQYQDWNTRIRELRKQIDQIGFKYIIVQKLLGKWGLLRLSNRNFCGSLDPEDAARKIIRWRKTFTDSLPGQVYIEASSEYYGLLDLFPRIYQDYSVVYIVRDARDWVTSQMNFGKAGFEHSLLHRLVSPTFPTSNRINCDTYFGSWESLSIIQKLSWAWERLNRFAMDTIKELPNAVTYRFEDLFLAQNKFQHQSDLVDFISRGLSVDQQKMKEWVSTPIHQSSSIYPSWVQWPRSDQEELLKICGPLMNELNYL